MSQSPWYWPLMLVFFFVVIIGRYLVIAGFFYGIFYCWFPARWRQKKLTDRSYKPGQLKKEIGWSTLSAAIFAVFASCTLWLWQSGYTRIYTDTTQNGTWWLLASLLLAMLFQETYYYWLHRLMHHPALFSQVHKVHHDSYTTSPFTAFSFHPLECLLQAIALPLLLIIVPLHPAVLVVLLSVMTLTSVINHLNIELYPQGSAKHPVGKWLIGATHHAAHHTLYRYNFGLYFTFWDRWLKTEAVSSKNARDQHGVSNTDNEDR
jgi:Delta7-sterol 5-desaturase